MTIPPLVIFDIDGTLSASRQPMDAEMPQLLMQLLARTKVAIMSGGGFPQFEKQFLIGFPPDAPFANLFLFPTSGAAFYRFLDGGWQQVYAETFSDHEKQEIQDALDAALAEEYEKPATTYGAIIEDRGSEIVFSANGQDAPLAIKSAWDPTHEKRERIIANLEKRLPACSIKIGGTNSIDITRAGVDKTYGIRKIKEYLGIPEKDMLYVGDAIFPGGNDYVVTETEVAWKKVADPEETKGLIRELLASA